MARDTYHERYSIIVMRDKGPRRSFSVRRGRLLWGLAMLFCLPFICAALGWWCWTLWQQNSQLHEAVTRYAYAYQKAHATAERLQNFETLLHEENVTGREMVLRRLASLPVSPQTAQEDSAHEHLPDIDLAYVKVTNVLTQVEKNDTMHITLELRNADSTKMLAGEVRPFLLTNEGRKIALHLTPEDAGSFRINRYKKADMLAAAPEGMHTSNTRLLVEVYDLENRLVYRNSYPITNQ
ncbi:MAG: hypothetical protein IJU65_11550 [Desulfovibrio sp.]|nr:hypothetical protein [Desulfovibrio sp.]